MQSKQTIARLLIVAAVAAIGFHSTAYALKGYSAMSESEDFRSASETKVFKHTITAPWSAARLKVAMRVERGEATLRLIDAKGATRWEKTFEKGRVSIDETFAGQGKWRVELRLRDATGGYEIRLIAV
ncbi:MAG: hypothetical protein QOC81_1870 [Thermoanaerobaculia bacterium]|jgi:hypothetical protein|nr:hypothetical protein [Thermoanaerobaculia bacterium]